MAHDLTLEGYLFKKKSHTRQRDFYQISVRTTLEDNECF